MKLASLLSTIQPIIDNRDNIIVYDTRPGYLWIHTGQGTVKTSITLDIMQGLRIDAYDLVQDRSIRDDRIKLTITQYEKLLTNIVETINQHTKRG